MKYKVIITFILFSFSILLIKMGVFFIQENDILMKAIKEKQKIYNKEPIDAIITRNTIIPGISGRKVNLKKSYLKMKKINEFKESLLVFDIIKPKKSISNIYNKVIISGNQTRNRISIITHKMNNYCFTEKMAININCQYNRKHTIHIEKISNNHLNKIKEIVRNGIIFYLENIDDLRIIVKYLKNNNYEIVTIDELIKE